jgi:hypothetical protein
VAVGQGAEVAWLDGSGAGPPDLVVGEWARVEGEGRATGIAASRVTIVSVSRTGARFGVTPRRDGKRLSITGTRWPARAGVSFVLRHLDGAQPAPFGTGKVDSRGNLIATVPVPAISGSGEGPLWLFATASERGNVVAQVAVPYSILASTSAPAGLMLVSGSGEQEGAVGSYCREGRCTEAVGVPLPGAPIAAGRGDVLGLRSRYGPDPYVGPSPTRLSARLYRYEESSPGSGVLLDGVFYFSQAGQQAVLALDAPGKPFSVALPANLAAGRYALVITATWPGGSAGETATYGFMIEVR